jgi:hypothetical protein
MATETVVDDDIFELEFAPEDQADSEYSAEALSAESAEKTRLKSLRRKITASAVRQSQSLPFLAAVELDMERHNPIGLKELFIVWLEKGNGKWLNPFGKYQGMAKLEEILFKFQGNITVLRPFVTLLRDLAQEGISPSSFVAHVMLPRMREDNNWRGWEANHLEALRVIAGALVEAKKEPPFNQEQVGSANSRLSRDVVLAKYVGRAVARYSISQLGDKAALDAYIRSWQKISLNNSLSIYFIRLNILHFIYAMSGKIDLVQLTAVIGQLPDIESAFAANFSEHISFDQFKKIQDINLYNHDIGPALPERRRLGYHNFDFIVEMKAYLDIIKALLEKNAGIYLCGYYARILRRYKDPATAETIAGLVRVVNDRGGMHIYRWHTKKLLGRSKEDMPAYIDFIAGHDGCDPEYPRIDLLFRDEELALEHQNALDEAGLLGLLRHFTGKNRESVSYKDLLRAYIAEHPESEALIAGYQAQLLAGADRQWTAEYARQLDQLNTEKHNLHRTLLRSVIRGIGGGFFSSKKSASFSDLFARFGEAQSQKQIIARTQFLMPIKALGHSPVNVNAYAREHINLKLIEKIWQFLQSAEPVTVSGIMPYINKWVLDLQEPAEKVFAEKTALEQAQGKAADEQARAAIAKDIAKKDAAINALNEKKRRYSAIMDSFESLTDDQKLILAFILAGAMARTDAAFAAHVTGLLLQRYRNLESVASRLEFLKEDINVDVLTYRQFAYLLNLLDTLFFALREDSKIQTLVEKDAVLRDILKPYLITRKKQITTDALDAAIKKMTEYAALQAERAKWQDILEKAESKTPDYFHAMEIYTSKTFVDSYYGDMGGICLSSQPRTILLPGFFVQRLADKTDNEIIGMSILFLSSGGFVSYSDRTKTRHFWQAFAFNPLHSVLSHYSAGQQLYLYLQFRLNMEKLAWTTGMPVVISGIETSWGLISNNGAFDSLIRKYELSKPTARRVYARGLSVFYSEEQFAKALLIIDPRGFESARSPAAIPSFYAHRETPDLSGKPGL